MAKKIVKYQTKSAVTPKKTYTNQNRSNIGFILMQDAISKSGMPSINKKTKLPADAMAGQARADAAYAKMQAFRAQKKKVGGIIKKKK